MAANSAQVNPTLSNNGFTGSSAALGNSATAAQAQLAVSRKGLASNALLSNLEPIEENGVVGKWVRDAKTGKLVFVPSNARVATTRRPAASRLAVTPVRASVGGALKGVMTSNISVAGSSAQARVKTATPTPTPAIAATSNQSFADYLKAGDEQVATRRAMVTTTAPSSAGGHTGAYAEPDMSQLDRGLMKSPRRDRSVN